MELRSERSGYFNLTLRMFYLFFVVVCLPFLQKKHIFREKGEKLFPRGAKSPSKGRARLAMKTNITFFAGNEILVIFLYTIFSKNVPFPRKPQKTVSVGVRRTQSPKHPPIIFFRCFYRFFFSNLRIK